jgi:hypothetical protein
MLDMPSIFAVSSARHFELGYGSFLGHRINDGQRRDSCIPALVRAPEVMNRGFHEFMRMINRHSASWRIVRPIRGQSPMADMHAENTLRTNPFANRAAACQN